MTSAAYGYKVVFGVISALGPKGLMVNFEIGAVSTELTSPSVSLQHVQSDILVLIQFESHSLLFASISCSDQLRCQASLVVRRQKLTESFCRAQQFIRGCNFHVCSGQKISANHFQTISTRFV